MFTDNLWAPWRMAYLRSISDKQTSLAADPPKSPVPVGSFLEHYWKHPADDDANHVLWRDEAGMILLNRYPYANGHLLVALGEPRPGILDYDPPRRAAFWRLTERATDLMQRTLNPQGINFGINQGQAAGAGVEGHLHAHLVPRWSGDVNFITVVGAVRVVPDSLERMAATYRETLMGMG